MLVTNQQYETARAMLPPEVRLIECSTDDAWARDTAPTFVLHPDGRRRGIDWGFNAWGGLTDGLYFPWTTTTTLPERSATSSAATAMICGMLS